MSDQKQQEAESEQTLDLRQKLADLDVPAGQSVDVTGGGGGVPGLKKPGSFPGQRIRLW